MSYGSTLGIEAGGRGVASGKSRKYLLLAAAIVLMVAGAILVGLSLRDIFGPRIGTGVISGFRSPEDVIRSYISSFDPAVRDKAVFILNSYVGRCGTVFSKSLRISAGSWTRVEFHAYSIIKYRIRISVSGFCLGTCDVYADLRDEMFNVVKVFGRISWETFEVHLPDGYYYIYLDNTYSAFTSKTVYVTVEACVNKYTVNDDMYKIAAIALWVADNINYVSDPRGFDYIQPPSETLRIGGGDCEDFAVLLASMYRSVGLDAAVGLIDTDGDGKIDHATALVHLNINADAVLKKLNAIAPALGAKVTGLSYFRSDDGGIWLIIDPPMSHREPWYIYHEPYKLMKIIK